MFEDYSRDLRNAWSALKPYVKVGDFTLRSGRKSDLYIDVKSALLDEMGVSIIVSMDKLRRKVCENSHVHYIGYGYGGAILATASSSLFIDRKATLIRGEKKNYGLKSAPIGPTPLHKSSLIILEDVVTTEGSIRECLAQLEEYDWGARALKKILSVVDRRSEQHRHLTVHSLFNEETIRQAMRDGDA